MSEQVRIYIDAKPVDASPGSTLIDALAAASPDDAQQVRDGKRLLTDSRGLPAAPDSTVYAGAIFRVINARSAGQSLPTT